MDPSALLGILSIIAFRFGLPVLAVFGSFWLASRTEMGRAILERLRSSGVDQAAWRDLVDEVQHLRGDVIELQERVDSIDRQLKSGDRPRLG